MKNRPIVSPFSVVLTSLKAGFDFTTRHWWLSAIPFLLDLLFWLGPRLSIVALWEQSLKEAGMTIAQFDEMLGSNLTLSTQELVKSVNLMTLLSPPVFGIPVLMTVPPEKLPINPLSIVISTNGMLILLYIGLILAGVLLAGVYFSLIAFLVQREEAENWEGYGRNYLPKIVRYIFFSVITLVALFVIFIPTAILLALTSLIHPLVMIAALVFLFTMTTWLAIFFAFTIPNFFLRKSSLFKNFSLSVSFVRAQLPTVLPFVLSTIVLAQVTSYIWRIADDGSWLTIVSLAGHAFVGTSLIVATFLFYKERSELQNS